jgi:hypothetical protein
MEKKAMSLNDAMETVVHADFKIYAADQEKTFFAIHQMQNSILILLQAVSNVV